MESIRKLVKKLGSSDRLRVCYEDGPTGYVYWQMAELGVKCEVIAPTLVPVNAIVRRVPPKGGICIETARAATHSMKMTRKGL